MWTEKNVKIMSKWKINQSGHDNICVVVYRLTKQVHFLVANSIMLATYVARLLLWKKIDNMDGLKKLYVIEIEILWANFGLPYLGCLALNSKWAMPIIKKQMRKLKRLIILLKNVKNVCWPSARNHGNNIYIWWNLHIKLELALLH
jgi:hypothetical protein